MSSTNEPDRCIKTEATVDGLSVYVEVVMHGDCPVEVQTSVVEADRSPDPRLAESAARRLATNEMLVNYSLSSGLPVGPLIVLLLNPPSKYTRIIAHALIAAMEA